MRVGVKSKVIAATVALCLPVLGQIGAHAANPKGSITLAGGLSAYVYSYDPVGIVDGDVLYFGASGLSYVPTGGGKPVSIPHTEDADDTSTAGDIVAWQTDTSNGTSVQHWTNVANGHSGIAKHLWLAAAPLGGVYVTQTNNGSIRLEYEQVGTGSVTDLGDLDFSDPYQEHATVGPDGVVVDEGGSGISPAIVDYVDFAAPGTVTQLDLSGLTTSQKKDLRCFSASASATGCSTDRDVARVSLTSGVAPVLTSATDAYEVAITDSATAWTVEHNDVDGGSEGDADDQTWSSVPVGGGTVRKARKPINDVVADSAKFYVGYAPAGGAGGLYDAPSAGGPLTQVVAAAYQPDAAYGIGIGPGRATWIDDKRADKPLWSRSLSSSGGKIVAGGATLTATQASGDSMSVSGNLTAYSAAVSGKTQKVRVVGRPSTATISGATSPQLSGNRLTYTNAKGDTVLDDLVTHHRTDLTSSLKAVAVTVWGNYVAYVTKRGAVYRTALTGPKNKTLLRPDVAKGDKVSYATVTEWGDWVAWEVFYQHGKSYTETSAVRNAHTLAKARKLKEFPIGSSAAGVLVEKQPGQYSLQSWSGATLFKVPAVGGASFDGGEYARPSVNGDLIAWIGRDQLPRVAPVLKGGTNRPRSLGDPATRPKVAPGKTWTLSLPTSAPLDACKVTIRRGRTVVKKLSCSHADAAVGVVGVSWKTASHQARGSYTWTVTASGKAGALLTTAGGKQATSGKVSVT